MPARSTPPRSASAARRTTQHTTASPVTRPVSRKAEPIMTEKQFNEAAAEFAQTVRETYQTVVERSVAAQERGAKLAQTVIESGIEELRSESEAARDLFQSLSAQPGQPASFRDTYQTFVATVTAAQERSIKLAQSLVESGLDELKSQTETAQTIVQTLAQQSEKQASALQTIARESAQAYVSFAFAPFAIFQKSFDAGK